MYTKYSMDQEKQDQKKFIDPVVTTPLLLLILKEMFTGLVGFLTWKGLDHIWEKFPKKKAVKKTKKAAKRKRYLLWDSKVEE
jgi:hypothetical protein